MTDIIEQNYFIEKDDHLTNDTPTIEPTVSESVTGTPDADTNSDIDEDIEKELQKIIEQKKLIEEMKRKEIEEEEILKQKIAESLINAKKQLDEFSNWMKEKLNEKSHNEIYNLFVEEYNAEYRMDVFENICDYFNDQSYVTDDTLFYWKAIIVAILMSNKKYKGCIQDLKFSIDNKNTNLRIVKDKHIFSCFIDDKFLCRLKENGNNYYVC